MTRICVDTSAYSHFKRGSPEAIDAVSRAAAVLVPSVVLGELRSGFLMGTRPDENERALAAFLARPVVRVLGVDAEAARIYAEIYVMLRRAGTPVPTNDMWIAAVAAREGAVVLTGDRHFEAIPRVGCRVLGSASRS
ncbi:MAG: type II toxin-antitoxin system VapC family toxin [Deltaproteobacteria bacterium]|nr:type II toxin-antitoxin system VapC family toxin [Deltaproteobacteria bacterium]